MLDLILFEVDMVTLKGKGWISNLGYIKSVKIVLWKLLHEVKDQATFLAFVTALQKESEIDTMAETQKPSSPYQATISGWQNSSIEAYLEAAIAWTQDSNFGEKQKIGDNPWQRLAGFLYAGKVYE